MPGVQNTTAAVAGLERGLHRISLGRRDALDRDYLGTGHLHRQHVAALDRATIDVNRARAALRGVASDMRAGQSELLAQQADQGKGGINVGRDGLAVDPQRKRDRHPGLLR
jgi:hypothetical protein